MKVAEVMKYIGTIREVKRCMGVNSSRDSMIEAIGVTTYEELCDFLDKMEIILLDMETK